MNAEAARAADSRDMKRYAFILTLKPGAEQAYDEVHRAVSPELLAVLKRAGVSEYSIFRRDRLLILTLRARDFELAWQEIERDPANTAWQKITGPLFEPMNDLRPGERFPMMEEVFYLP